MPPLPHSVNAWHVVYSQAGYTERATGSGQSLKDQRVAVTTLWFLAGNQGAGGFESWALGQIVYAWSQILARVFRESFIYDSPKLNAA